MKKKSILGRMNEMDQEVERISDDGQKAEDDH